MYDYNFIVDGVSIADPSNSFLKWGRIGFIVSLKCPDLPLPFSIRSPCRMARFMITA